MKSSAVIPLTIAEASRYDRFRAAELASINAKSPSPEEMIEVILAERDRIERSARLAEAAYAAPFDGREVRRCAVLQRAAEFLGIIVQHKDEVKAVLQAPVARRRRA